MYKLILADGTEIKNLTKNGDNYISDKKIDENLFRGNLSTLTIIDEEETITDEEETITMKNAELIQQIEFDGKFWICFRELSERELKDMDMEAKIEYLAMMTDVDIDI